MLHGDVNGPLLQIWKANYQTSLFENNSKAGKMLHYHETQPIL